MPGRIDDHDIARALLKEKTVAAAVLTDKAICLGATAPGEKKDMNKMNKERIA